jgi:hypothetical protein
MAEEQSNKIKDVLKDVSIEKIKISIEEKKEKKISTEDKIQMKKAVLQNKVEEFKSKFVNEKEITELSYEEFKKRAAHEPSFVDCFGMFSLFVMDIVVPIEKRLDSSVSKFGYPSIEGNIKCGHLFKDKIKYCQIQNGMAVFFDDYNHSVMSEKRWFIDDSGILSKRFNSMDEMSQSAFSLTYQASTTICASIGINNNTKYTLDAPIANLFSGISKKKADLNILPKSYGTVLYIPNTKMGFISGLLSYRIGESKKRLVILVDVPYTYITSNHHFMCYIMDENEDLTHDLYKLLKKSSISKGGKDWIQHSFHVKGIIGRDTDTQFSSKKIVFRIEIYDAVEAQPPEYVIDLAEASCLRKPESDFSLLLNCHQISDKIEIAVEDPDMLSAWISVINANTKVCHGIMFIPIKFQYLIIHFIHLLILMKIVLFKYSWEERNTLTILWKV